MMPNKYSMAHQQANIPSLSWVDAGWGKGDNCANKLRMMNGAFETFFVLLQAIQDCEDDEHRNVMTAELTDAGDAGWGSGVTDLDDAFTHWLGPGHWTDNNVGSYMKAHGMFGGQNPAFAGLSPSCCWGLPTNIMPGPLAAVNFFSALDDKMDKLQDAIQDHNEQLPLMAKAVASKNGSQVDKAFKAITESGKNRQTIPLDAGVWYRTEGVRRSGRNCRARWNYVCEGDLGHRHVLERSAASATNRNL